MANAVTSILGPLSLGASVTPASGKAAKISQDAGTNAFAGPYNYGGALTDSNNPVTTEIDGEGITELAATAPNAVAARTAYFGNPDSDKAAFALVEKLADKVFAASPSGQAERALDFASEAFGTQAAAYQAANAAKAIEGGGQLGLVAETVAKYAVIGMGLIAAAIIIPSFFGKK